MTQRHMTPLALAVFSLACLATMLPMGWWRTAALVTTWCGVVGVAALAASDLLRPGGWQRGVWLELVFGLWMSVILLEVSS